MSNYTIYDIYRQIGFLIADLRDYQQGTVTADGLETIIQNFEYIKDKLVSVTFNELPDNG